MTTGQPSNIPLQETASLRRLARRLLFDPASVDDVLQEAWLVALRSGHGDHSQGWEHGVVRRLAKQRTRTARRRHFHEQRAAGQHGDSPATDELSARLETTRLLLEAVRAMPDPYRAVIVLRFFDDLAPREIARRQSIPVNTVRTHLQRGLALLRQQLAHPEGDSRRDLAALLPLVGPLSPFTLRLASGSSSVSRWAGALLMSLKVKTVVTVALTLLLLTFAGMGAAWNLPEDAKPVVGALSPTRDGAEPERDLGLPALLATAENSHEPTPRLPEARPWTIHGQLRAEGAPLADSPVRVRVWMGFTEEGHPWQDTRARTADDGEFVVSFPDPQSSVYLRVESVDEDWLQTPSEQVIVRGDPTPDFTIHLLSVDGCLVGRVLDEEQQGIAGAMVHSWFREVTTDALGEFRLPGSTARPEIQGWVAAPGFVSTRLRGFLREAGDVHFPDVVLQAQAMIQGRLVNEGGQGIAGALVQKGTYPPSSTRTDETGAFVVPGVDPSAKRVQLDVKAAGYCVTRHELSTEALAGELFEIVLETGVQATGRVLDGQDNPIAGAYICLDRAPPRDEPTEFAWTDELGHFEFEHVLPGARKVWAQRSGYVTEETAVPDFGAGELSLRLESGHFVGGVVRDNRSQPVAGARIIFSGLGKHVEQIYGSLDSDENGRFLYDGLPGEQLQIVIIATGYLYQETVVEGMDREDAVYQLERSGKLTGRVVDGVTGQAIPTFQLRFVNPRLEEGEQRLFGYGAVWSSPGYAFVDTDGSWHTGDESLTPGAVIGLEASAQGYGLGILDHVLVTVDPDPNKLVIRLYQGTRITGQVLDEATGLPVKGALVRRFTERNPWQPLQYAANDETRSTTDEFGRFELNDVPIEEMSLAIEHESYAIAVDGPFDPRSGGLVERPVFLNQGLAIRGHLLEGGGQPLANEMIRVLSTGDSTVEYDGSCKTDAEGAFQVNGLTNGLYQVTWEEALPNGESVFALMNRVRVEGEDADVQLQPRGTAKLLGRVIPASGVQLIAGLKVFVVPVRTSTTLEEPEVGPIPQRGAPVVDGSFEVPYLEPGHWRVFILGAEQGVRYSGMLEVEVSDGEQLTVTVPCSAQ